MQKWQTLALGPKIRAYLQLEGEGKEANFTGFAEDFLAHVEKHPPESLMDIADELLAMDLPLVVLSLIDLYPKLWIVDFRSLLIEGLAAMLGGEPERALERFSEANRLNPEEPAPYVNACEILASQELWPQHQQWSEVGIAHCPNYRRLWEAAYLSASKSCPGRELAYLQDLAKQVTSWVGSSLAAELRAPSDTIHQVEVLKPFYDGGERDPEFLLEYTGALGANGQFSMIPMIVWQSAKNQTLPWQLHCHSLQAHLAMNDKVSFFAESKKLLENPGSMPMTYRESIEKLREEVSGE
jgi:hypothetical protein